MKKMLLSTTTVLVLAIFRSFSGIQSAHGFSPSVSGISFNQYVWSQKKKNLCVAQSDSVDTSSSLFEPSSSPIQQQLTEVSVIVPKPMGLILEEVDASNLEAGIIIQKMDPSGGVASACRSRSVKERPDVCVRDKIMAVNGTPCVKASLETIMDLIANSSGSDNSVSLVLGRRKDSIKVTWPNGVSIAALPGEYLGNLAYEASYDRIEYSCRSGSCGTCEQAAEINGSGNIKLVRPCVARIPLGKTSIIEMYETAR